MTTITILGTSSMMPTKERNHSALFIKTGGEGLLFDCGEGTQRQMSIADLPKSAISHIFISHWHADHTAGLIGLLQTITNSVQKQTVTIHGPIGTIAKMHHLVKVSVYEDKLPVDIKEYDAKDIVCLVKTNNYSVYAANLEHNTPCLGFSFIEADKRKMKTQILEKLGVPKGPLYAKLQQGEDIVFENKKILSKDVTTLTKGKKFTYIPDTLFTQNAISLAENAQVLLSESSYMSEHEEKAEEYYHMTAKQAAQIAQLSSVKTLYLTHFSLRYKDLQPLLEEARTLFENTHLAYDFLKINL